MIHANVRQPSRIGEAQEVQAQATRQEAEEIAEWLSSNDFHNLLAAKDRLDQMEPNAAAATLQRALRRDLILYRSGRRRFGGLLLLAAALCVGIVCWNSLYIVAASVWLPYLLLPAWLAAPFLIAHYDAYRRCRRRLKNMVTLLQRGGSFDAIGELIEAMAVGDDEISFLATAGLPPLLAHMQTTDGPRLEPKHHRYLCQALRGYNAHLILAILKALEQIGDHQAIPDVQRLTACPGWIAESNRIQQVAKQCLLSLQKRTEAQQSPSTLLRAATPSASPANSLLRPMQAVSTAEPRHLLRAAAQEPQP